MNATKPSIVNEPATTATPRCQHRSLEGRCRQLADGPAGTLCFDHARSEQQARNDFTLLGALHNLLADSLILRTLPAMAKEDGQTQIIFDMPGPDRGRPERGANVPSPAQPPAASPEPALRS
jgi:hypothetical protein